MPYHRPPEADELTLPGAEEGAAGPHLRVKKGGGQSNVDKNIAELIIRELREGVKIMLDRALKEQWVLRDNGQGLSYCLEPEFAYVAPIN
mmetsp:Transcript_26631/g.37166  ORF Transcript_26631/g.37166 Transcript_26631/m.37166 type:complete len:90 (-) Transcript_26631:96-365(-)